MLTDGERLRGLVVRPQVTVERAWKHLLLVLAWAGDADGITSGIDQLTTDPDSMTVRAALALSSGDAEQSVRFVAPVMESFVAGAQTPRTGQPTIALLLDARARELLRDGPGAAVSLEGALDQLEVDGVILPFLVFGDPGLLSRHLKRGTTHHASLIYELQDRLRGRQPDAGRTVAPLSDPLSDSELRVLRYLATNLQAQDIASELFVSVHTVRTHMRHIYTKLGVHKRAEAVDRARALGLMGQAAGRH